MVHMGLSKAKTNRFPPGQLCAQEENDREHQLWPVVKPAKKDSENKFFETKPHGRTTIKTAKKVKLQR